MLVAVFAGPLAAAGPKSALFVQLGHTQYVKAIAVSRDGSQVLSGGVDGAVILWDSASGREIHTLNGHSGFVSAVAFAPDGRMALSGSWDGSARLWDLETGREIRKLESLGAKVPGMGQVFAVAVNPNGRQAVAAALSGVQLWDIATGASNTLTNYPTQAATFSPDGKYLLTSGTSTEHLILWDAATGKKVLDFGKPTFDVSPKVVTALSFSPDGRLALVASTDEKLRLWDVAEGKLIRTLDGHAVGVKNQTAVAFGPDGRTAVSSGSDDKTVRLWDIETGTVIRTYPGHSVGVPTVALTPDGRQLLSASDQFVKRWDVATGRELPGFHGHSDYLGDVAVTPDGSRVLARATDQNQRAGVRAWAIATGKGAERMAGPAFSSLQVSPDGSRVLFRGFQKETRFSNGKLSLWDRASGKEIRSWTAHEKGIGRTAFSADGKQILTAGIWDHTIKLWDGASGEQLLDLPGHAKSVESLAFSPDGRMILAGGYDGTQFTLKLWEIPSGREIRSWTAHQLHIGAAAFSPDGRRILSGSWDKTVRLWDAGSGALLFALAGHEARVDTVAFSPDGRFALSGGQDHVLKLWDLSTGKEVRTLAGHRSGVTAVVFTPDGKQAVSAGADSTLRLWDLASGKELVQMVSFTDGEWLTITPEGYFTASSAKAAEHLNIREGGRVYGVDQFYDVFYRPDLVELALAGKDITRLVGLTIDDALRGPPPMVTAVDVPAATAGEKAKVTYRIQSAGGGIGDVRVFHNGKLVHSDGTARPAPEALLGKKAQQVTGEALVSQMRSLAANGAKNFTLMGAVVTAPKPERYEATVEIEPVPGENDIAVVAFNAQNSIQSAARAASFTSTRPPAAPRLFVLAVGIDEYKDKSVSLAFANKDARDIAARWPAQAGALYGEGNVFVETLGNAQATRQGVLNKIGDLASRIRPTDHFVLFVASHGVLLGDQYYMVTHDYDGNLQPGKLISANEIVEFSKRIKALSQLYILDTCHAGGLEGVVAGLYDARVSVLAKRMGLHVFASASSAQEALDGFEGNGLFTHTLLSGLNNNAQADSNADRQVSVVELGGYARGRTRDIATRLRHRQEPLILQFGQDRTIYSLP